MRDTITTPANGSNYETAEHYVYVMLRPDGTPCYVGKGKGNRHRSMRRDYNPHLIRIIRNAGGRLTSIKFADGLTEAEANGFEIALISEFGREHQGGILTNLTDGGDGVTGLVPTPESRAKIAARQTRYHASMGAARQALRISRSSPDTEFFYCSFVGCEIIVGRIENGRVIGAGQARDPRNGDPRPHYCSRHNTPDKRRAA